MSHHTIIARLGARDSQQPVLSRLQTKITQINFLKNNGQLDFGLGQALTGLRDLGLTPSETSVDLALLAATVTAADTRISRNRNAQDLWTRELSLHIPVFDPVLWSSQTGLLSKLLNFLTGDRWSLYFHERPEIERGLVRESTTPRMINPTSVCLFSGGLDSFIGAIDFFLREELHYLSAITGILLLVNTKKSVQTYCLADLLKILAMSGHASVLRKIRL